MSTVFFVEPDNANRKEALLDLLDSLQKLYPGQIRSEPAISVSTDVPEIEQLISHLIANQNASSAEPPVPEKKKRVARRKHGLPMQKSSVGSGDPPNFPAPAAPPAHDTFAFVAADLNAEAALRQAEGEDKNVSPQSFTWKILKSGKECNSFSSLLKNRKLFPGDRLQHKERGLYEVAEKPGGRGLSLRRLSS